MELFISNQFYVQFYTPSKVNKIKDNKEINLPFSKGSLGGWN